MKSKMITIRNILLALTILCMVSGTAWVAYAVIYGQPDGNEHPYVGVATNQIDRTCSCVAISSEFLVTSAHCFETWGQEVYVSFEPAVDPTNPPPLLTGHWYPHPDFELGGGPGLPGFDTHDVAVIQLDSPHNLSRYAQLPDEYFVDSLPNGTYVEVVGYGLTHWVRGGGPPYWPFLEEGLTRYSAPARLIPSKHTQSGEYIKVSGDPAQGKGNACYGDSGGPNLLYGTDTILALTSYMANPMCAGVGYSNRIDTPYALEFIEDYLLPLP